MIDGIEGSDRASVVGERETTRPQCGGRFVVRFRQHCCERAGWAGSGGWAGSKGPRDRVVVKNSVNSFGRTSRIPGPPLCETRQTIPFSVPRRSNSPPLRPSGRSRATQHAELAFQGFQLVHAHKGYLKGWMGSWSRKYAGWSPPSTCLLLPSRDDALSRSSRPIQLLPTMESN